MRYKVDRPTEVLHLDEWLPSYGESDVGFRSDGGDVVVSIHFDAGSGRARRDLRFKNVCAFHIESMPGVQGVEFAFKSKRPIGNLVEYGSSEWADAWTAHFKREGLNWVFHHYDLLFLSENRAIGVVAESFSLGDIVK